MKTQFVTGMALGLVLIATPAFASRTHYKSTLTTQADGSAAGGEGHFTYDNTTMTLCGKVTYSGLTGGPIDSAALKNANDQTLVKTVTPGPSPLTIVTTLTAGQANALNQDPPPGFYIALGNAANPATNDPDQNGELNGELNPDATGTDQCPPGADAGSGNDAGSSNDAGPTTTSDAGAGEARGARRARARRRATRPSTPAMTRPRPTTETTTPARRRRSRRRRTAAAARRPARRRREWRCSWASSPPRRWVVARADEGRSDAAQPRSSRRRSAACSVRSVGIVERSIPSMTRTCAMLGEIPLSSAFEPRRRTVRTMPMN